MSPLLFNQRQLLNILNGERRLRHIDLKNDSRMTPTFDIGDLVIVRKQVKSDASAGVSAKLVFRSKGPYRVIERIGESHSYKLQKLPFLEGMGIPGRLIKENAARMEKLPSTLILHKRADGADSRFAAMHRDLAKAPLSKWLGIPQYGGYEKADQEEWAFQPLKSMWNEAVVDDDSSDDEDDPNGDPAPEPAPAKTPGRNPAPKPAPVTGQAEKPVPEPPANLPVKRVLTKLYRSIEISPTKMFLLRTRNTGAWRIGQVNLLKTDPQAALTFGRYYVQWWTPTLTDRKTRIIKDCRFAPDVRMKGNGLRQPIRPTRVEEALKSDPSIEWMSDEIHITEDRIVGPFDFETVRGIHVPPDAKIVRGTKKPEKKKQAISETERVPQYVWDELEKRGPEMKVRVSDIHNKVVDPTAF
jgi:hypothetical protein